MGIIGSKRRVPLPAGIKEATKRNSVDDVPCLAGWLVRS